MAKNSVQLPTQEKLIRFFNHPKVVFGLWCLLLIGVCLKGYFRPIHNNYLIFKYTYFHAIDGLNLYDLYPTEHQDSNHYGPLFSLLFAPFALLPNYVGMVLWQICNTFFLYFAIKQIPLDQTRVNAIYWIVAHELLTAMFSVQFNISIAAIIVLAFVYIEKGKNIWATFFIALGTFVKLYGIVGLAFFFFVKRKLNFLVWMLIWSVVLFLLPMLISSPDFVIGSYKSWFLSLMEKQQQNASLTSRQDVSIMGIVRTVFQDASIPNWPFLLVGIILFCLPYLRVKIHKIFSFRLLYLASTLIFTVIFSNSSESPTYIIAFVGVAIWFVLLESPRKGHYIALFVFAMLLTSFSPSDLFPKFIREQYVIRYNLKALPCVLIWATLFCQQLFGRFNKVDRI